MRLAIADANRFGARSTIPSKQFIDVVQEAFARTRAELFNGAPDIDAYMVSMSATAIALVPNPHKQTPRIARGIPDGLHDSDGFPEFGVR